MSLHVSVPTSNRHGKHELSKIDFEMIDAAFKVLLQSGSDRATADLRQFGSGWWTA